MMVVKSYGLVGMGFGWQFPVPSLADVRKREGAMADADNAIRFDNHHPMVVFHYRVF
jgi:hypothetical protein